MTNGPKPLLVLALYSPVCPVDESHVCFTYTTPAAGARRGVELRCPSPGDEPDGRCGALLQTRPKRAAAA